MTMTTTLEKIDKVSVFDSQRMEHLSFKAHKGSCFAAPRLAFVFKCVDALPCGPNATKSKVGAE